MDHTNRFSSKVDDYVKHRPTYPAEVIKLLRNEIGLTPHWRIADIGSGTGISAKLFLDHGNEVFAVEPNAPMREAAERLLGNQAKFYSIDAAAEATTLPNATIDLVIAAQAFHWFDRNAARSEFQRILRPGGYVLLMWNDRDLGSTPFLKGYEQLLLDFGTDYKEVRHNNIGESEIADFFAKGNPVKHVTFPNTQTMDLEGVKGRLLSSSYIPPIDHPRHAPMLARLREVFNSTHSNGYVEILYRTELFLGQLNF